MVTMDFLIFFTPHNIVLPSAVFLTLVNGISVPPVLKLKDLGVSLFDLSLFPHIKSISKFCWFYLQSLISFPFTCLLIGSRHYYLLLG